MKLTTVMLLGVALIAGAAVGYMFRPSVEAPAPAKQEKAKAAIGDKGEGASVRALRSRIAELEAQLAAKSPDGERRNRVGNGLSPREWQEKMKKDNPERYARMTNNIARWQNDRVARAERKIDFLTSIDVSGMSDDVRKNHSRLLYLIAKREEYEQKLGELRGFEIDVPPEERRKIFEEMQKVDGQIREANARERRNLMLEAAKNLGLNEDEADEVAETIREIIANTDNGRGGFGPFGGGRGRRELQEVIEQFE